MTTSLKRAGTVLLSVLLLCTLALSAGAASKLRVGVKFWKTGSDKESMANSGIDTSREASLTRQSNGTYTLTLPIQQVSKMGVTGYLTGLTIGDVTYNGTVTGDVTKDTGVLTIKNLSLIHISEPTRRTPISYAVFCLKKKRNTERTHT